MSRATNKSTQIIKRAAKHEKPLIHAMQPSWIQDCVSQPRLGVHNFLQDLCIIVNAPYAHLRILSRSGRYFTMVDSIGPYKEIGWQRRGHLLDNKDGAKIYYHFIDYKKSKDCEALKNKFKIDTNEYKYLDSVTYGLWVPLRIKDVDLGYITLSWDTLPIQTDKEIIVKTYLADHAEYLPLVYQAGRSVIADKLLSQLWTDSAGILSTTDEHECYNSISDTCIKLWGKDITVYIGQISEEKSHIEIINVKGRREDEAKKNIAKYNMSLGRGILGYLIDSDSPIISYSVAKDKRFKYHSMREDGRSQGSAIAIKLQDSQKKAAIALMSVEHEQENYFDHDDLRYLTGIARIGYENIMAHKNIAEGTSRKIDALFTQIAHDVIEPLQALVANADVLKNESSEALNYLFRSFDANKFIEDVSLRATNFLEESLNLYRVMRRHLDAGLDGATTRRTKGIVRLYPMLNALVDQWRSRAETQGIEIRTLYGYLKDIKICCDEAELKSTLGHIMGNAIKYSFWGRKQDQNGQSKFGRYIKIRGRVRMDKAIIEFENYGIGILYDEIKLVTEKYYRGKLALREGKAGTGRGLWTVKSFLDSINGYMNISSMPNTSDKYGPYTNTFSLHFPICSETEADNGQYTLD